MASQLRVDRITPVLGVAAVSQTAGGNATGGIVQVTYSNSNGLTFANADTPSTAWVATGIFGAISPTRVDSKIIIIANPSIMVYQNSGNQANGSVKIMRKIGSGSYEECTPITIGSQVGFYDYGGSGGLMYNNQCIVGVDEPQTTQTINYQIYVKRINGTGIRLGYQLTADIGSNSFLTLMEAAGR